MPTSGHRQPETYESYIRGVPELQFAHGCDSGQDKSALAHQLALAIVRDKDALPGHDPPGKPPLRHRL
jgi:hypothetical protein